MQYQWFEDIKSRHNNGLTKLPYLMLRCSGSDSTKFLQGQLSCDLAKISNHTLKQGLYCNLTGRIEADFWIYRENETWVLIIHESIAESILNLLKKYALFSKVSFELDSQHHVYTDLNFETYGLGSEETGKMTSFMLGHAIKIHDHLPLYLFIMDDTSLKDNYSQAVLAWDLIQIFLVIPHISNKTQNMFLPHRLNFHTLGYIAFDKGCYLGQEVIARMHYKSKLKHGLFHISFEDKIQLQPGDKLVDQNSAFTLDIVNVVNEESTTHMLISTDKTNFGTKEITPNPNVSIKIKWANNG